MGRPLGSPFAGLTHVVAAAFATADFAIGAKGERPAADARRRRDACSRTPAACADAAASTRTLSLARIAACTAQPRAETSRSGRSS